MPTLPGKLPPYRPLQKLIDAFNALRDYVATLRPSQSYNTLTSHTSVGVRRQSLGAEGGSSTSEFRGEYNQNFAYKLGDWFLVSVGPEAGNYRAIKDCPANPTGTATYFPWAGTGYFVLIGRLSDQSSWL